MDYFNRLLRSMPEPADVWADADRQYGEDTLAAGYYAAGVFQGYVMVLKTALGSLLDDPRADAPVDPAPLEEVDAPWVDRRAG